MGYAFSPRREQHFAPTSEKSSGNEMGGLNAYKPADRVNSQRRQPDWSTGMADKAIGQRQHLL